MKTSKARIIVVFVLVFILLLASCSGEINNKTENKPDDKPTETTVKPFYDKITAQQLAETMEWGWNLGNTLDARQDWNRDITYPYNEGLDSEIVWGEERTTKAIIEFGTQIGYKSIRIPITWVNHLVGQGKYGDYTIDPAWMARVKQVVDWAMDAGYVVILNEHHSVHDENMTKSTIDHCEGYNVSTADKGESMAFLRAIWTQICETFNNEYGERLIFETLNEPRHAFPTGRDLNGPESDHDKGFHEWGVVEDCPECMAEVEILNEMNQMILDIIRASGGNNAKRFVMIPGISTMLGSVLIDEFKMPRDTATGKLMVTVHCYPLSYWNKMFDANIQDEFTGYFTALNEKFVSKGIPVVIGECGVAKAYTAWENNEEVTLYSYKDSNTNSERVNCMTFLANMAGRYKMAILNWDAGVETGMATIDRKTLSVVEPQFLTAVLKAYQDGKKAGIPSSSDEPGGNSSNSPAEVEGNLVSNGTFDNGTEFSVYGSGATTVITSGVGVDGTKALAVTQNETWGELQINLSEQYTADKNYYVEVSAKDNGSTGSNKALGISFIVVSGAVWDTFGEEYYKCDEIYEGQVMSSDDVQILGLVSNPYVGLGSGYATASAVIPAAEIARLLTETTEKYGSGDPSLKKFIVKIHAGGQEDTGYSYYIDNLVVKELE